MDLQYDYIYNKVNAADVNLEDITFSARNAKILQRLRDGDDKLTNLRLGMMEVCDFIISEGDDLGWLGYLIGESQCLKSLLIWGMPEGEGGEQQINAFVKGIARNHSIRDISINSLSDDTRAAIVRAVSNYSQLESLRIDCHNDFGPNSHSAVGTLLESGVCQLRKLWLFGNGIDDDAVDTFANGFKGIAKSLEVFVLSESSIGNVGLLAIVAGLANSTILKTLVFAENDFFLAADGLCALSGLLQSLPNTLEHLNLPRCRINDEGLQAFIQGSAIHCRELILEGNESITATGLSHLSNSLQSGSCCIEALNLLDIPSAIGDDGMKALARGLAHNKSMRSLCLGTLFNNAAMPPAQWLAFSTALCDPSSVNSTYLSNHTILRIVDKYDRNTFLPEDIDLYLRLNEQHPKYAARCKILMKHRHLNMRPFLQWRLKCLPVALAWFEQAKTCTTLNVQLPVEERRVVEESDVEFESRVLSAMYEFVRGKPMKVMESRNGLLLAAAYDDKIAKIEEEHKMDFEQRDRTNVQLQEEIAHPEYENKSIDIEEEKKADLEQRDRKIIQLEKEISRLDNDDKIIYFCRLLTVFALCFLFGYC